jgi:hypothetical protein
LNEEVTAHKSRRSELGVRKRFQIAAIQKFRLLQQLIEAKVAGKEIVATPASEGPQVINLMEALKQSVARVQGTNGVKPRKTTRRLVRKIS